MVFLQHFAPVLTIIIYMSFSYKIIHKYSVGNQEQLTKTNKEVTSRRTTTYIYSYIYIYIYIYIHTHKYIHLVYIVVLNFLVLYVLIGKKTSFVVLKNKAVL